jgi:hypothetical protein
MNWVDAQAWCQAQAGSVVEAGCESNGVAGCEGFLARADTQEKLSAIRAGFSGLERVALWIGLYEADHTSGETYGDQEWKWVDDGTLIWHQGYGPKNMDPFNNEEEQCAYVSTDCIFDGLDAAWSSTTMTASPRNPDKSENVVTATNEVNHHTRCMYDSNCAKQRPFVCELTETILDRCFDYSNLEVPCDWNDPQQRRDSYPLHTIQVSINAGERTRSTLLGGVTGLIAVVVTALVAAASW